jgi:hypothetical protein
MAAFLTAAWILLLLAGLLATALLLAGLLTWVLVLLTRLLILIAHSGNLPGLNVAGINGRAPSSVAMEHLFRWDHCAAKPCLHCGSKEPAAKLSSVQAL